MLRNSTLISRVMVLLVVVALIFVSACSTNTSAPAQIEKVNAAFSSSVASENPLWVTKEQGLFEKNGLEVNVTQITGGSSTVVQAMLGGNIDIAQIGATAVVDANLQGADFVVVADIINRLVMSIYSTKEINDVAALKGKSIAVTRAGTITDFGARYVLKKAGVEPEKEVGIVQSGGVPEALAALQSGNVQAAILLSPQTIKAKELGFKELVDLGTLDLEFQVNGLVVSKKWLSSHQGTLEKFLKAYLQGIAFAKKDREATNKIIGQYTKVEDKSILDDSYNLYVDKYLSKKPYPSAPAIQNVLDFVAPRDPKAKELKAQDMVDQSVMKKLDESGFIDGLYK